MRRRRKVEVKKVEKPAARKPSREERIKRFVVRKYNARPETVKVTATTSLGNWHCIFVDDKGNNRLVVVHPDEIE